MEAGDLHMTAFLSIREINSRNLGRLYKNVWDAGVKKFFPLAAHWGGISQHWKILDNFWNYVGGKLHNHVILWVWEITRCEKREKVPSEVLYQVQKCFSPGGPHGGISQILGQMFGISPHVDRRGKNIFELFRGPLEVPSCVFRI